MTKATKKAEFKGRLEMLDPLWVQILEAKPNPLFGEDAHEWVRFLGRSMKIRLAIRGYVGKRVMFEDRVEMEEAALDRLLPRLAEKHALALAEHALHMIEIEFLDEANPLERFFRFGTDPAGMVLPIEVKL
ncbi:MAG TPA: hypothetical protein VE030_11165 [Burkholderiales bacterium]|nr:hypothetical protein [Burkholderiales bacterium]